MTNKVSLFSEGEGSHSSLVLGNGVVIPRVGCETAQTFLVPVKQICPARREVVRVKGIRKGRRTVSLAFCRPHYVTTCLMRQRKKRAGAWLLASGS